MLLVKREFIILIVAWLLSITNDLFLGAGIPLKNIFIEKAPYRLDTAGEVSRIKTARYLAQMRKPKRRKVKRTVRRKPIKRKTARTPDFFKMMLGQ